VNVNIGGAMYIGSQGLIYKECTPELAGTFEQVKGCFFNCDGRYRHTIGLNLQGDDVGTWCREKVQSDYIVTKLCIASDGTKYHAGEYLTGYTFATAPCGTGSPLECGDDGKFWEAGDNNKKEVT
jgi:hypothetical protein